MKFSPKSPWLLAVLGVGALAALACDPGGVGDPCIPEDEYHPEFGGYAETEANVETKSFQCVTRVCLVNHFRGRASCPYGQTEAEVDAQNYQCTIPGTTDEFVTVPVAPQFEERREFDAVYCSCRCDGPDANARYCECPSGYSCEELVPDLGGSLGSGQLAGSYCVKDGTRYDTRNPPVGDCVRPNCDNTE